MIVRRYLARSQEEALRKARAELGPDCVIFLTKERPDVSGVEVIVAAEGTPDWIAPTPRKPESAAEPTEVAPESPSARRKVTGNPTPPKDAPAEKRDAPASTTRRWLEAVRRELARTAYGAAVGAGESARPTAPRPTEHRLRELLEAQEVGEELIAQILKNLEQEALRGSGSLAATLARALQGVVPIGRPESRCAPVWAFVGPSGVGKTTVLAKLAARLSRSFDRRVGILSLDVHRAGAQEQLAAYAEILGLPFRVAYAPEEVRAAAEELSSCDHLLVDSPGCSPRNRSDVERLHRQLSFFSDREVFLVVSSVARLSDLWATANAFYDFPITQLVPTKVDEVTSVGNIVTFAAQARLPIAYYSTGPDLPEDLVVASLRYVARLLLRSPEVRYA